MKAWKRILSLKKKSIKKSDIEINLVNSLSDAPLVRPEFYEKYGISDEENKIKFYDDNFEKIKKKEKEDIEIDSDTDDNFEKKKEIIIIDSETDDQNEKKNKKNKFISEERKTFGNIGSICSCLEHIPRKFIQKE